MSETPETDAYCWMIQDREGSQGEIVDANFSRNLEKQRDDLQSKLSTVYQWIERHHQDGFTDSLTYWQNLEKIGDKYSDRIDEAEHERDAARKDAERLAKGLAHMAAKNHHMAKPFDHLCVCVDCEDARKALRLHEALTAKK